MDGTAYRPAQTLGGVRGVGQGLPQKWLVADANDEPADVLVSSAAQMCDLTPRRLDPHRQVP